VKRSTIVLLLTVTCALMLLFGMTATAWAEEETPSPETWQVRTIATPVSGVIPSFIAAEDGRLAWTGAGGGNSRMFVYNLSFGSNATVPVTLPGSYYNPSADGPWVAYQGATTGAFDDIWLYDTGNGQVTRVTNNADAGDWNDWNPRVDGDRIVWEKDMLGSNPKPGIYLYNIAMGGRSLIIPGSEYRNPDIWGDWVVCVKNDRTLGVNGSQIILFNLLSKEERSIPMVDGAITTGTMNNDGPCIDNGWVVWSSGDIWQAGGTDRSSSYQIYAYNIDSGQTIQITNNVAGNFSPSIEGSTVAWETKQPNAIMTYDIASATIVQVSQVTVAGESVRSPDVDGDAIAWYSNKGLFYAVRGSQATTFPDVPADHPYYTAIEGMAALKIIEGYQNGNFGPADPVIRQQFAKMIVLTMAVNDPTNFTTTTNDKFLFTDAPAMISQTPTGELYPYHYVSKAALTGLTVGYPDGSFRPTNKITRAQVITMIVRAGSRVLQSPRSTWRGVLDYTDPNHGQNIRIAEYNGLLAGIVGNSSGTLSGWDTTGNATRGEVAQMLWNLLGKLTPAG
jgi:Tol biopolymer transport system component